MARGPLDLWRQVESMQRVMCYHYRSQAKQREISCAMTLLHGVKCKRELRRAQGARSRTGQKATVKIFLTDSKISAKTPGHHRAPSCGATHGKYYLNLQINNADYKLGHPCLTCCYMSWRWHSFMQWDQHKTKAKTCLLLLCWSWQCREYGNKKKCFAISPQAV